MNRLAVFSLVALGAGAGAGTVVYANHLNKGGKGKAAKKLHGKHAHESARHHARHLAHRAGKHGKTTIAGMHLDNVALGASVGAALTAVLLWKPCACLPGAASVPPGTTASLPAPPAGPGTIPSSTQGTFGPIR